MVNILDPFGFMCAAREIERLPGYPKRAYQTHHTAAATVDATVRTMGYIMEWWAAAGRVMGVPMNPVANAVLLTAKQHLTSRHEKPDFGIPTITYAGSQHPVEQYVVAMEKPKPFCELRHFKSVNAGKGPRVLLVAPLSGHYSTLLRETVRTLLEKGADVYLTDWCNARDVPKNKGRFGVRSPITYVIDFARELRRIDERPIHFVAVCQPCPATLAATALLEQWRDPAAPASVTMIAGPNNPKAAPNALTKMAETMKLSDLKMESIPAGLAGEGRLVWSGYKQLAGFVLPKIDAHVLAAQHFLVDRFFADVSQLWGAGNLAQKCSEQIEKHSKFYDEFYAVLDMPAEFVRGTALAWYKKNMLAEGTLRWRDPVTGKTHDVDLGAIRKTRILCIEGERDDICPPGQTSSILDNCIGLPKEKYTKRLAEGVGHYGAFSGEGFRNWFVDWIFENINRAEAESPFTPRPASKAMTLAA